MTFKLIVAGGRDFNDFDLLDRKLTALLSNHKPENVEIVSGMALGADALGVEWAKRYGYKWTPFKADWGNLDVEPCKIRVNKYGKEYNVLAGINRNHAMGDYADALVAFHDKVSTGTQDMIDYAHKKKLLVRVINY